MKSAWIIAAIFLPLALSAGEEHSKEHAQQFDRLDADHNGVISAAEANAAPRLSKKFATLDTDKNGSLSRDELEQHAQNKRREMHDRMEDKFKAADANRDGQLSAEEAKSMPRMANDFAVIDANHDGQVSRDELREHGKAMHKQRMEQHDAMHGEDDMHGDRHGAGKQGQADAKAPPNKPQ